MLDALLTVEPVTAEDAVGIAELRHAGHRGLSLGDRACLALAGELGVSVVTADRAWADLGLNVAISLIRSSRSGYSDGGGATRFTASVSASIDWTI